jgi:vitamin B12 transporter
MHKSTVSFVASATLVASLGANTLNLDPIVVSASKTEQSLKNVTANVDIITAEEIEERHYTTVSEALNTLPGVSITLNGGLGTTQSVFLRGMDTNRLLVLINGIRYQDPSNTSGANFSHLLISDIERIEVIKGTQSGIWGADASAGVINIITKTAQKGTHAGINVERGSFNTKKWGGYISHGTDLYDLKFSFNRVLSDSFSAQAPLGRDLDLYENDPYANTTLNISGRLRPTSTDTITFNAIDISALANYDGYNAPDAIQRSDVDNRLYGLSYEKHVANHLFSVKANRSTFYRDELDATYGVKIFEGETRQLEANDRIGYRQNDFLLLGGSRESFGVDTLQASGTLGTKKVDNKALFATNTNVFGDLTLSESLRHDSYSNFGGKTTGKIGAKYSLTPDIFLSSNYGTAYTAPNLIQVLNPWGTSNPDLKPENSRSYDISVGIKNLLVTYFDNRVKDLIEWYDPTPLNWLNNDPHYKNLDGITTFRGYEISFQERFWNVFSGYVNYTHMSTFKDEEGKDLPRRAKREAKGGIGYYGIENAHFGLDARYVGTRYDRADQKGDQTGRYTLLDLSANYDISDYFSLYGKIDNLTDKNYQTVEGYSSSPRAWYVGMKVSF